ncbi:MAG: alpha/beta hydrolase, partial [Rhodospirillaceae bacterium]|nr:alpha/beta hydrolase [Rhodospirillaceae bacterium]
MPEVIFNGPDGRLEGRYHHSRRPNAPIALILHPHPQQGGTMNNRVVFEVYQTFARRGFSTLRFNFRGVGRSQGGYDEGLGELSDAAAALDWLQAGNPDAEKCWV